MRRPVGMGALLLLVGVGIAGCKPRPGPETQSREAEAERDGEGDKTPHSQGAHDQIGDASVLNGASLDAGPAAGTLDTGDTRDAGGPNGVL